MGMFVVSIRTGSTQQEVVSAYARDVVGRIKTQKKVVSLSVSRGGGDGEHSIDTDEV